MLNDYFEINYQKLKEISIKLIGEKQSDDLLHFVIEELYKCDQKKINEVIKKKQMTFYFVRVMLNQAHSNTSRYHYKYRKYYQYHIAFGLDNIAKEDLTENSEEEIENKIEMEQRLNWIEQKLTDLYWFDTEVFKIYYREGFSLSDMQRATGINKNTLYKAIRNVKNYLINER